MKFFRAFTANGTRDILKERFLQKYRIFRGNGAEAKLQAVASLMSEHYSYYNIPHTASQISAELLPFACMDDADCRDYLSEYLMLHMNNKVASDAVNLSALRQRINEVLCDPECAPEEWELLKGFFEDKGTVRGMLVASSGIVLWMQWLTRGTLLHIGGE